MEEEKIAGKKMAGKKILVLATGGTISSVQGEEGLEPGLGIEGMISLAAGLSSNYEIFSKDILKMDSSNIQPEEWQYIARCIFESYKDYDGVVVTHGTDTMAYTASMLSYMLKNIPVPVVLTGSQLPITHPLTDAFDNLRLAFAMAASGAAGVFVAFDSKVMLGTRAVKTRTMGFNAFESVNCPPVASAGGKGLKVLSELIKKPSGAPKLLDELSTEVFLIKLTPGLDPKIFEMLCNMNYRGIIIEAFGAGGLHFVHRDLVSAIKRLISKGISVVACSQCLYEQSDFSIYQTGKLALAEGIIQGLDMTTEAAVTKLMWALGQTDDPKKVAEFFNTDIAGEIDLSLA